ncbi:unnamed protein product [Ectocarpus sp. 6 AP-2014]
MEFALLFITPCFLFSSFSRTASRRVRKPALARAKSAPVAWNSDLTYPLHTNQA